MTTYSVGAAARILKVSPSRLRYWRRTELVNARGEARRGSDASAFDFRDLVCIKAIVSLLEQGVSLRRIRRSVDEVRRRAPEIDDPLAALRLWVEGSERVVVSHGGVLAEPEGQLVLDFGASETGRTVSSIDRVPTASSATRVASESPESALDWFERGCRLDFDPDTYAQAAEAYRRSLEADPELADSHCNLGAVLYNQGNRVAAKGSFERCLALDVEHVEAHFNLANLLEEEGRNDLALRHYRAALSADPFYADVHINLALLYEKLERRRRAHEHWRRYLQLEKNGLWAEVARQRLDEG